MAGIYIHIPFCRQACHYCDFHFSTNRDLQNEMVYTIVSELKSRYPYINDSVQTIYFGGGTPSLLSVNQIRLFLDTIYNFFQVSENVEITLEANPEDSTIEYMTAIRQMGVNRLSIGIQTFNDDRLSWMNRNHSSSQGTEALQQARSAGFENISLDLIYALPDHSRDDWKKDLEKIVKLNPEHISMYGLTIEDKTVFGKWEKENRLVQVSEGEAAQQYLFAIDYLKEFDFFQYEVSNFGKKGFFSKHNNAYWNGVPYLGVGPGAHSFNGVSRRFNVRNNSKYIKAIASHSEYWKKEELSKNQLINEKILTQLRTVRGLNLSEVNQQLAIPLEKVHKGFLEHIYKLELIRIANGFLRLTPKGFLVADEIALKFFL